MQDLLVAGRTVRRGVPVGLHPLGARHFYGVLPYRHTAARQRQHRYHQRHAHDREGGRRGRVRARLREGPAFGRARVGVQPVSAAGGRAGARSARFPRHHAGRGVPRLHLGPHLSPWLKFKGGKGIAVAVGCLFVTFGWVGACLELLDLRRAGGGDEARVGRVDRRRRDMPVLRAVLLLGGLAGLGVLHHRGADGGVGASRQHRPPARRHGKPHRPEERGLRAADGGNARKESP